MGGDKRVEKLGEGFPDGRQSHQPDSERGKPKSKGEENTETMKKTTKNTIGLRLSYG